jgi:hypothetical protein
MFRLALLAGTIVLLASTPAQAQRFYGWDGGYHSSTAAEGYQRGMADVIRSQGAYNLYTAQAAGELEAARSQAIQNNLQATQVYFEKQRINQEWRDSQRNTPTASDIARLSARNQPHTLSAGQFDSVTGQLNWPNTLQDPMFDQARGIVDSVFQRLAEGQGSLSIRDKQLGRDAIAQLRSQLLGLISDLNPQVYMQSRRFLDGLDQQLNI